MSWNIDDIKRLESSGKIKGFVYQKPEKNSTKQAKNIPASYALGRLKAGNMNKTEAAYAKYLETLKETGEVSWFEFEPMNLKLADKCFYRVDFLVMMKSGQLECHEVKGGYMTDDSLVKFKVAACKFPFTFRMFSLKKGEWIELYTI